MSDEQLAEAAIKTTLFARVSPAHKQRIIKALQSRQHTVGFMGDGINDAPALRTADVGISVDTAVDIAKESADMILLEKSLLVLEEGVVEGRKVFANILKYVRMGASSNFGNMFSVLGASVFVPFLPMAPIQILANNLLYDISQTAIPTDDVDPEQVEKPRPWDMKQLTRFIVFIGPCSSIFDYTTFFMMLYVFNCWNISTPEAAAHSASLFQTGWFVESLLTQTLIIHVIRTNKIPFLQSRPSWPLMAMSAVIMAIGIAIPFTPLGGYLGFTALPPLYWPLLATRSCATCLTQLSRCGCCEEVDLTGQEDRSSSTPECGEHTLTTPVRRLLKTPATGPPCAFRAHLPAHGEEDRQREPSERQRERQRKDGRLQTPEAASPRGHVVPPRRSQVRRRHRHDLQGLDDGVVPGHQGAQRARRTSS